MDSRLLERAAQRLEEQADLPVFPGRIDGNRPFISIPVAIACAIGGVQRGPDNVLLFAALEAAAETRDTWDVLRTAGVSPEEILAWASENDKFVDTIPSPIDRVRQAADFIRELKTRSAP